MPIKNLTEKHRSIRQGKIHLGIMKISPKTGKEHPLEVNYFVLPEELKQIYGDEPKELHISLPSARFDQNFNEYLEKVFPQYLKRYQGGKDYGVMVCKGDGETATVVDAEAKRGLKEIKCPCEYLESGECKRHGIFCFRVQEIPTLNVYQISTSSYNSILNINSFIRDLLEHCLTFKIDPSFYRLILRRSEQTIQRLENGSAKSSKHYILELDLDSRHHKSLYDIPSLPKLTSAAIDIRQLPRPDESKDELFFPKNGFKPEDEKGNEEPELPNKDNGAPDIEQLRKDFIDLVAIYVNLSGKLPKKQADRIGELKKSGSVDEIIQAMDYFRAETAKMAPKTKGLF